MLLRCEKCNGRKDILGLGGMIKKCDACHGVGSVEAHKVELVNDKIETPARKRGRPKQKVGE